MAAGSQLSFSAKAVCTQKRHATDQLTLPVSAAKGGSMIQHRDVHSNQPEVFRDNGVSPSDGGADIQLQHVQAWIGQVA